MKRDNLFQLSRLGISVFLLSALMGCSFSTAFVDARREAGQVAPVGSSSDNRPVICYGFDKQEEIEKLAQNECAKTGRIAVFERTDSFSCAFFAPQKAIYRCEKTSEPVLPYQSECQLKENQNSSCVN